MDFRFWVLGFGFWILGFGFWILGFGFWVLGFGFWVLGFGFWALGFGALGHLKTSPGGQAAGGLWHEFCGPWRLLELLEVSGGVAPRVEVEVCGGLKAPGPWKRLDTPGGPGGGPQKILSIQENGN